MAKDRPEPELDRELSDLPPELRWREWMRRIEAVLFASADTGAARGPGRAWWGRGPRSICWSRTLPPIWRGGSSRSPRWPGGWMFRTRAAYAPAIRAAADVGDQVLDLSEFDVAVLAAIAYHQPITRDGLKDIFGKEISRDLIGRLHARGSDRDRAKVASTRCALYLRDDRAVPGGVRVGQPARSSGSGAAGGCGACG